MYDFDKKCLENELLVMQELLPPHEHLVRLYDVFDEAEYVHLVLEKVNGGELLDRLIHKTKYTECEARDVCKVVFEAMRHCHEHQVAHRDIKPENLLLASETVSTEYGRCQTSGASRRRQLTLFFFPGVFSWPRYFHVVCC